MTEFSWALGDTSDRQIIADRVFHQPRDFVFKMYSKPEFVDQWWGPQGFETKTIQMEFKPGGEWIYEMIAEDGRVFKNTITYHEIISNKKIVYSNKSSDSDGSDEFLTIITFEQQSSDTRLVVKMIFQTIDQYDVVVNTFNAIEGLHQTLDRLSDFISNSEVLYRGK